jgi:CheY-like chemotaxis protein
MPQIDGYAFVRAVRARPRSAEVPAMALTAYVRAEDAELAKKAR